MNLKLSELQDFHTDSFFEWDIRRGYKEQRNMSFHKIVRITADGNMIYWFTLMFQTSSDPGKIYSLDIQCLGQCLIISFVCAT